MAEGDLDWGAAHEELLPQMVSIHDELRELHLDKSSTYGTEDDALANFVETADAEDREPESVVLTRILEKSFRALHMIKSGNVEAIKEWPDIASLALCAEALRRRR